MDCCPAMSGESESRLILRMALPSMAAMIASSLCVLLDALLLGRADLSLSAAVSVSLPVQSLLQTIGFTLGTGAGSFISRSLGGGRAADALSAASTAFFAAFFISIALCVPGFLFAAPLCRLLGADDAALPAAALYMRFTLAGGPLLCMNLVLSSLLRSLGDTRANMLAFCLAAAVSMPLQLLLITALSLGVAGSGAVMLLREGLTLAALCFFLLRRHRRMRPRPGLFSLSRGIWAKIMRSGVPTLIRQGLTSVSAALLSRTAAAFGPAALAGMGLAARIMALVSSAVIGFGQGFQPVCGFAFGAGDLERVRRSYRFSMRCVVLSLLALGAALLFLYTPVLTLFSPAPQAAQFAQKALRLQSLSLFAQGAVIMMNMLVLSMGFPVRASIIASSRQGFVLIPLLLILPRLLGELGLFIAQSVSDLLSLVLCFVLSRSCLSAESPPVTRSSCAPCGCSDAPTASR